MENNLENKNITELLLGTSQEELTEVPKGKVEIKRLSAKLKNKVEYEVRALNPDEYADVTAKVIKYGKKGLENVQIQEGKKFAVLKATVDPSFKNSDLMKHYGAATPKMLLEKMLLPGEIDALYEKIMELSGFDDEEDIAEEVKNE